MYLVTMEDRGKAQVLRVNANDPSEAQRIAVRRYREAHPNGFGAVKSCELYRLPAKDTDPRKGVTKCQVCRAPLNGDDCLEVRGKVVCPDCAAVFHRGKVKDGIIFSTLKGAAVLMALLYLSRIPQQPVEYDLTKYVPPRRAWDADSAVLRQGDTLVLNQDVSAKRSSGRATTWKAGKKFWVVSSIVDPVRKQGMLRVAPAGMGMGGAVAFTDQQIQSYFR